MQGLLQSSSGFPSLKRPGSEILQTAGGGGSGMELDPLEGDWTASVPDM